MPGMVDVSYAVILTRGVDRAAVAIGTIAAQALDGELLLVLNDADDAMRAYARTLAADGARLLHGDLRRREPRHRAVASGARVPVRSARRPRAPHRGDGRRGAGPAPQPALSPLPRRAQPGTVSPALRGLARRAGAARGCARRA